MANIKISELEEYTKAKDSDLLVIVDTTNNETKKIQAGNLGTGGGDTLPIGAIVEYDGTTVPEGYEKVSDGNFSNIYSLDEQVAGTWVNNETLYKKTFNVDAIAVGNNQSIDVSALNIGAVRNFEGTLIYQVDQALYQSFLSRKSTTYWDISNNTIVIYVPEGENPIIGGNLTIYYTKANN